jgi:hypothetical protein
MEGLGRCVFGLLCNRVFLFMSLVRAVLPTQPNSKDARASEIHSCHEMNLFGWAKAAHWELVFYVLFDNEHILDLRSKRLKFYVSRFCGTKVAKDELVTTTFLPQIQRQLHLCTCCLLLLDELKLPLRQLGRYALQVICFTLKPTLPGPDGQAYEQRKTRNDEREDLELVHAQRLSGLTFDMSGAVRRPLDGGVRSHLHAAGR